MAIPHYVYLRNPITTGPIIPNNPTSFTVVGSVVNGTYLFATRSVAIKPEQDLGFAGYGGALGIVDLNGDSTPIFLGGLTGLTQSNHLTSGPGDYFFSSGSNRIYTFSHSTPTTPTVANTFTHANAGPAPMVWVPETERLYVTKTGLISVYNVSNPLSPTHVISKSLTVGFYATILGSDGNLYSCDASVGSMIDIVSNPNDPVLVDTVSGGTTEWGFHRNGSHALLVSQDSGQVHTVDVSDPLGAGLSTLGVTAVVAPRYPLVESNGFVYVACTNRLVCVDVRNPAAPVIAFQNTDGTVHDNIYSMAQSGDYLYTTSTDDNSFVKTRINREP